MALWSSPIAVKVTLSSETGKETRRVVLPNGAATKLDEFLAILRDRFESSLSHKITYVDTDRDTITISTDAELKDAFALGVKNVEVMAALGSEQQVARPDEWEIVGAGAPQSSRQLAAASAGARADGSGAGVASWSNQLQFWLNGEEIIVTNPSPTLRLLDWLRDTKGLTGTKQGCGEGGCGICTVTLTRKDPSTGKLELVPINSCLRRLCAIDGCHILTTEGVGCQSNGFHAVQSAIAAGNGSQCGYCTPGWVMNMYALLEKNRTPSAEEVEQHFDGNLCRCTGYRPILTAFGTFARGGKRCGQHHSIRHPAALLSHVAQPLRYVDEATQEEWYRPTTLAEYMAVASQVGSKKLRPVCANTADGVTKYYGQPPEQVGSVFMDITLLSELHGVRASLEGLRVGASLPIEKLISALEQGAAGTPSFEVLAEHMKRIASAQIRSVGSWAGNVMLTREHPEFPSDMVTILATAGAKFEVLVGTATEATTMTIEQLLATKGDALLVSMTIPRHPAGTVFHTFKVAQRHVFAHAIVNLGACLAIDSGADTVSDARLVLGGATKTVLNAVETAAVLRGKRLDSTTFQQALAALQREIAADASTDPRQSQAYRTHLAGSLLYKAFLSARASVPADFRSALVPFAQADARPVSSGAENFGVDSGESPIGQYVTKRAAFIQASGEALYPSDFGGKEALFGQLVLSTAANAKLVALDPSKALKMPGVHDFITASAIPGLNCVNGPLGDDNLKEKLFFEVNDVIPCVGVSLGLIVADTWRHARDAAKMVVQQYRDVGSVVTGIEDALQLSAIQGPVAGPSGATAAPAAHHRRRGLRHNLQAGVEKLAAAPSIRNNLLSAKATFKTGGQRHFYMETQSACVIPHDGNQWEVIVSDQDSNFTQQCLSMLLAVPQHQINVKVPRAGGAFGGKLMRQLITCGAVAVAANKLRRAVRIQNERSDDMTSVGGREAMQFDYDVAFDKEGMLDSLNMVLTSDPGWFYGDCNGDMQMAVAWSDNCYHFKNFKVTPQAAVTNTVHCTAMRAPGCLQSVLAAEVVLEHVAKAVGKSADEVREQNFYRLGDTTPFGDELGREGYNWTIPILWPKIKKDAKYEERKKAIAAFNSENRWRKKGIAISPVKYVMGLDAYSSGATVCIYGDGTVLVSVGGSEIGQGLTTKVVLCVANALGAPLEKVKVGPRETSKVPDNTGTGGSGTSECTSEAAIVACNKLVALLAPYRTDGATWEAAVTAASKAKVGLLASGWYNYKKNDNNSTYATYGTAVSEVMIDTLTGEVQVDRVDILMDLGTQLDAAVDIGQLQGGFVIALGFLLTEELKVDASGTQLHLGTWEYKIPSAYDIPVEFNVSLLKDSPNPTGIKGSKASAEPAMCLIPSVYLAIKNAIYAGRQESGLGDAWFPLDTPLTPEAIAAACGVPSSKLALPA